MRVERIVGEVRRLRSMSPLWEMAQEGIDIKSIKVGGALIPDG